MMKSLYLRIAELSRVVGESYPQAAAEFQRARQILQDVRQDGLTECFADAQQHFRACEAVCTDFAEKLSDLAELTCQHLPKVWLRLRFVVVFGTRWHEEEAFDWDAAVGELRTIESEAASRPAIRTPEDDEPLTVREPNKKAFQAWFIRATLGISNQTEIAEVMTRQGVPATQGQVSKWLNQVEEYRNAGGILSAPASIAKPQPIAPRACQ